MHFKWHLCSNDWLLVFCFLFCVCLRGTEKGSQAFDEFLSLLGKRVKMKGFTKYRAQLDNRSEFCLLHSSATGMALIMSKDFSSCTVISYFRLVQYMDAVHGCCLIVYVLSVVDGPGAYMYFQPELITSTWLWSTPVLATCWLVGNASAGFEGLQESQFACKAFFLLSLCFWKQKIERLVAEMDMYVYP